MVTFTNTTFDLGNTGRGVTLIVDPTEIEPTPLEWLAPVLEYMMEEPDESPPPESP